MQNKQSSEDIPQNGFGLWEAVRATFSQAPDKLKEAAENLPSIFAEKEEDIDLREKRKVYLSIAKFLCEKLQKPLPVCVGITHILCNESDPEMLRYCVIDNETKKLLPIVQQAILTIKVNYQSIKNTRNYNRIVEIYFINQGKPVAAKIEEEIAWEYLPLDVRESRLREGGQTVGFKLYPQEQ